MARLNTPPHVYVTVWGDLHNSAHVCVKKEGGAILAVVLLLPPASCSGDAVFRCERETTLFGIRKRSRLEMSG